VPVYTNKLTKIIQKKTWVSLGIGLLAFFVTPIVLILLTITIIGIPFFGGIFEFIISAVGLGAILIVKKTFYSELRLKKLI